MKNFNIFLEFNYPIDEANIVILGIPLDTTPLRKGSHQAPQKIRNATELIEDYSPNLKLDITEKKIHDAGNLTFSMEFEESLYLIKERISYILQRYPGKRIVFIGGEHTITLPIIEAYREAYHELHIIQIDAHLDLRDEYAKRKYSHGTVMRRCWEILGRKRIYQFGIRSGTKEEFDFAEKETVLIPSLDPLPQYLQELSYKPIYLTIDIDIVDPSIAPGVSAPEPGGYDFQQLLNFIYEIAKLNIIAFDLVEYTPTFDHSDLTAILCSKLLRECILAFWGKEV
jgi:agmatinase